LNNALGTPERKQAIEPVLKRIDERNTTLPSVRGVDLHDSIQRERDLALFHKLIQAAHVALA
jgi:hypothetical protein